MVVVRKPLKVANRVGIAESGPEREVVSVVRLDRKAKEPSAPERTSDALKHPRQVSEINEHVACDHEIKSARLRFQKLGQIHADELVIDLALSRLLQHVRGKVDTGQRASERP